MQKLQDSVFSIVKTTNLSPAVFSYLQPSEDFPDKTPLGGILSDTKHGWLALGPKFCVVDLRTGLKVAQRTFGASLSNFRTIVTSVVELPTPLTENSQQLIISLECEDIAGMICVFHVNGSQILRCIQTEIVVTELAVCESLPDGPFTCFDGAIMAGTKSGEVFVFDLNRSSLLQALKDISQGYEHMIRSEENLATIKFLPLNLLQQIEAQRYHALENDHHIAVLLNENSIVDGQYIFRNPDGTVRMKAKRDHIRVTVVQYIPQLGSLAVGFNFGAFQIWNLMNLDLEFTSQVNVECLPVTHFGFQEPCDDPRAFCYLWVVFSVIDRFDEEEFPLAVMYSLTYQGKRMLSDIKCLYQEFLTATVRFQVELSTTDESAQLWGGRCISCHTYSVNSMLCGEGEDSNLNICQLVWECWGEKANTAAQYGMLLFDLDQWYKDQMPATYTLQSNAFMSATQCSELARGATATLDLRLVPSSVSVYCAASRLEEHFYPNSLRYDCICLNTSEACVLSTTGIQRQIINSLDEVGPTALLNPARLYQACVHTGLAPIYLDTTTHPDQEEQRRYLLSVALEARLSRFLKRCAHDWATGSHVGAGCTLSFLVDWCWKRAVELKENATELTTPLFTSSSMPDRNVVRCLEHCVQQLTQLTGLLDAVLTKCCNLVVPDALSEMEEKYKGIGTVSLYFQVVQWFLRCGLLPERLDGRAALPYPGTQLTALYCKRRMKLRRLQEHSDDADSNNSCALLYIDQLIEHEFGGERIHEIWMRGGSESNGLYPPPSLYSLLRLYLLPDIAEEHKHSLVLYLLVDYSMVYDEVRYEAVIRRLMQFPTMFGLSNTAIKATQAFWHLDHRDFDFALDQLQCLTGNTLSEWQHHVVLSSLLAQKKTQAALQYLHVRKPAPIQSNDLNSSKVNDHDKLEDWQSCCNLYLARALVFEALDVIRMCVQNVTSMEDKTFILNFFFKSCRNTGQLSRLLQITLLPFEEDTFIRYLENCNESQTSDILIMYYLQHARYLEAERYNNKIRSSKRPKDLTASVESLADIMDREGARDTLVEVMCSSLPGITNSVAHVAFDSDLEPHIFAPKPMSVYIQAKSPKNTYTYKSSFIQDTIENASETWIHRPKARKGLKRALNIEETPFICTPKLVRDRMSSSMEQESESTPRKRPRLAGPGARGGRGGRGGGGPAALQVSADTARQLAALLHVPDHSAPRPPRTPRTPRTPRADTPHSILKVRNAEIVREVVSPVDSRYLGEESDDELETASNHTHFSDSTNKHLRFTIPTASESGSTPSPPADHTEGLVDKDGLSIDSFVTTESHAMTEPNPLESPPKKKATDIKVQSRKTLKDSVRGRRSLSMSANSSLSDDPNTSFESIADIPITLINPRYSGERRRSYPRDTESTVSYIKDRSVEVKESSKIEIPKTPKGRRGIRGSSGESTPLMNRSRSVTPERADSPVAMTPLHQVRNTRSRSRTPEVSPRSSPLDTIQEQPKQESESEPHPTKTTLSVPRQQRGRSKSRTPERIEKVMESPRLEAISESPSKSSESPPSSPIKRSLRSRSRTPEVDFEMSTNLSNTSPRVLRSRSKTPENLMSPKKDSKSVKKPLSRIVLEANAIAVSKQNLERQPDPEGPVVENIIECTPMKASSSAPGLMDVTFSPIISKSILHSPGDSFTRTTENQKADDSVVEMKSLSGFTINETKFEKSVLHSYQSSVAEVSREASGSNAEASVSKVEMKSIAAFTLSETYFEKSVLQSYQSSVGETSNVQEEIPSSDKNNDPNPTDTNTSLNITDINKSVLASQESSLVENPSTSKATIPDTQPSTSKDVTSNTAHVSSLMTDDSETEDWRNRDPQDVIQKEKEKIVEIEREINEIENDIDEMQEASETDNEDQDNDTSGDISGSDSMIDESEDSDNEQSTYESSSLSSLGSPDESDEVISIGDTDDSNDNNPDNNRRNNPSHNPRDNPSNNPPNAPPDNLPNAPPNNSSNYSRNDPPNDLSYNSRTDPPNSPCNELQQSSRNEPHSKTNNEEKKKKGKIIDERNIETKCETTSDKKETSEDQDPLNQAQASMMTDDNSMHSDHSAANLNYSDEKDVEMAEQDNNKEENQALDTEMEETSAPIEIQVEVEGNPATEDLKHDVPGSSKQDPQTKDETTPTETQKDVVDASGGKVKENESTKGLKRTPEGDVPTIDVRAKSADKELKDKESKPASRAKRTRSTTSNKSTKDTDGDNPEPRTPITRKRSQSATSNKSIAEELKTPEDTPSRRRPKTPTSTEVRKILTRRASKELSEKMDDSQILEDPNMTPKRRSTRSKGKNTDDNASVTSESSVKSSRSKANEEAGDVRPIRKGKKSVTTKPDLSVIPELTVEESTSKIESKDDVISEYSSSRRLTRHQKSVLESWLEPKPSPAPRRRTSTASRASAISEHSHEGDDDGSSTHSSAFDVQPIDRISLMNKGDFDGSPDSMELQSNISPESIASDASKQRKQRMGRAASEAKTTPKAARITRRISVDVAGSPAPGSPARGRRASFNRACEALHTPKGRRTSTDVRAESESQQGSPVSGSDVTPARRPRRGSSQSVSSQSKGETTKRSKKLSTSEEIKETKKK